MRANFTSNSPWLCPLMSLTASFMVLLPGLWSGAAFSLGGLAFHRLSGAGLQPRLCPRRSFRQFLGLANDDVISIRPGNRALNQENVFCVADLNDLEVLRRASHLAHMPGHAQPASHGAGKQTVANRAAAAMPALRAVRDVSAAEMVPLDHALKTAAFRDTNRIDEIARGKQGDAHSITGLHLDGELAKLADALYRRRVEPLQVTVQRLGQTRLFLAAEAQLHCLVTVGLDGLALNYPIRPGQHNGDGHDVALSVIYLRLSQFFSNQAEHGEEMEYWSIGVAECWVATPQHSNTPWLRCVLFRFTELDFDGDVHAGRQVELLQFIHGLGSRVNDVEQPLVRALLEGFLGFLVRVRRAADREPLDA